MDLRIKQTQDGRIVVADASGHEFEFVMATVRGNQTLDAMAPKWSGGEEPPSAKRYILEARALAEREAVDRGWLSL